MALHGHRRGRTIPPFRPPNRQKVGLGGITKAKRRKPTLRPPNRKPIRTFKQRRRR